MAILSLGSPVVMDFTPHSSLGSRTEMIENNESSNMPHEELMQMNSGEPLKEYQPFSVILMSRSLLIFKDKAYSGIVLIGLIFYIMQWIIFCATHISEFVPFLLDYLHGIKDSEVQLIDKVCSYLPVRNL